MQLLFVLFVKIAFGNSAIIRIHNASGFINFSDNVNHGTNYNGTTVYLDSDLSLSDETLEPIGKDDSNKFFGTFDGQGHIISDLKMNISSSYYAGLFGCSTGLTIRNVVLDSSCSITSSYSGSNNVYAGGFVGRCRAINRQCNIENNVNMANVKSGGRISSHNILNLGGIAGSLWPSSSYSAYVKNCANYGSVTDLGTSGGSIIGGVIGELFSLYVYNCLNYGTITHGGTTSYHLQLGGIVGYSYYAYIENCVSAGNIYSTKTSYIGSIVGSVVSFSTHINNCYYTSESSGYNLYGDGTPESETETPVSPSTVNSALIAKLNDYAEKNDTWNKWLLNENNTSVSFIINYGKGFTVNSQIILLPDLASSSWRNFSGWYTDANLATPFNLSRVNAEIALYGMFCEPSNYTVTFDVNGGNEIDESGIIVGCMSYYGTLPTPSKEGHTFTGWFTERERGDKVELGDKVKTLNSHTLYAHWVINNYTVAFDFDNGTTVNKAFVYNASVEYPKEEEMNKEGYIFNGWDKSVFNMLAHSTTITAQWIPNNYTVTFDANEGNDLTVTTIAVTFNSSYGPLPEAGRTGYIFLGWFTEKANGVKVTNETIVTIPNDHTLYTHWEKTTNQVEIVFSSKDLSREEIEGIIKRYRDLNFTITVFEEEHGEIKVIIKFADTEEATRFVRNANALSRDDDNNMIKRVGFVPDSDNSFSLLLYPTLFIIPLL